MPVKLPRPLLVPVMVAHAQNKLPMSSSHGGRLENLLSLWSLLPLKHLP